MAEFHQNYLNWIRLTNLTDSKRFHFMGFSVISCGQTQWMTNQLYMVTLLKIQRETVLTTLVRNLSNLY